MSSSRLIIYGLSLKGATIILQLAALVFIARIAGSDVFGKVSALVAISSFLLMPLSAVFPTRLIKNSSGKRDDEFLKSEIHHASFWYILFSVPVFVFLSTNVVFSAQYINVTINYIGYALSVYVLISCAELVLKGKALTAELLQGLLPVTILLIGCYFFFEISNEGVEALNGYALYSISFLVPAVIIKTAKKEKFLIPTLNFKRLVRFIEKWKVDYVELAVFNILTSVLPVILISSMGLLGLYREAGFLKIAIRRELNSKNY